MNLENLKFKLLKSDRVNLAKGKSVKQSTLSGEHWANMSIDGNMVTYSLTRTGKRTWWRIGFVKPTLFREVFIIAALAAKKHIELVLFPMFFFFESLYFLLNQNLLSTFEQSATSVNLFDKSRVKQVRL